MAVYERLSRIPITFMLGVCNEEKRIRVVLDHACFWADEIIVIIKKSTDRTREICLEYGDRIKIIDVPYSPKGAEDPRPYVNYSSNDWIFFSTASEIATFKLVVQAKRILSETKGMLDLIYVPRKMYSFGINSCKSPWYISYYPFLINRKKAIVSNIIHDNYRPRNPENTARIIFAEDCCVYHLTHPSAKKYITDMGQYFISEVNDRISPKEKLRECFRQLKTRKEFITGNINLEDDLLGIYCAWQIYWLGTALFVWEKQRGIDVPFFYNKLKQEILEKEWMSRFFDKKSLENDTAPALAEFPWDNLDSILNDNDIFLKLSGRDICNKIKVIYILGTDYIKEKKLLFMSFPRLQKIYLVDEQLNMKEHISSVIEEDSRIEFISLDASHGKDKIKSFVKKLVKRHDFVPPDMLMNSFAGIEQKVIADFCAFLPNKPKIIYTKISGDQDSLTFPIFDELEKEYRIVSSIRAKNEAKALFVSLNMLTSFYLKNNYYVAEIKENESKKTCLFKLIPLLGFRAIRIVGRLILKLLPYRIVIYRIPS